jgi:hypothetical protein
MLGQNHFLPRTFHYFSLMILPLKIWRYVFCDIDIDIDHKCMNE